MTREEKIRAIYKEIANKEITLGCKIFIEGEKWVIVDEDKYWEWIATLRGDWWVTREKPEYEFEVVGHPVMIGDVIDWIELYWSGYAQDLRFSKERKRKIDIILLQWDKKRKPIEEQSDECIDFIYNLIKK